MSRHTFAKLTEQGESGIKSPVFEALFAPDVTLNGPFLMKPLQNKGLAIGFLTEVFAIAGYPKYTYQFTDDHRTTLFLWEAEVQGPDNRMFPLEGSLAITEGEDGLIHQVTSYLRPLQVAILLKERMVSSIASVLPKEYWDATPQDVK